MPQLDELARPTSLDFLAGGGEMGALMRAHDWSATPLGRPGNWPQSLRTAVRIMLTSRQPMWIGWGDELIYLYNGPYKSIIGGKHPRALGRPTREVWQELWDDIGPMLATAMKGDEGTYVEEQLLVMERNGYPEETYYTFSYSPIPDDDGSPGGIICANTDDTQRVIGERQLALLRELAARTVDARTWKDVSERSAEALATDPHDLPFALTYVASDGEAELRLACVSGFERGHPAVPEVLDPTNSPLWPIAETLKTHEPELVPDLAGRFASPLPTGHWQQPPSQAAVFFIPAAGEAEHHGLLIVGLNPFRLFDDNYRGFLDLVSGQIAAAIANAKAYEEERKRAEVLAEIDRAKTTFFSNVSHEFRTPLTLMLGLLEEVLAKPEGGVIPENRALVDVAHRNGLRLLRLVNALLDFSRIEAGRAQATYRPADLAVLTADLASSFRAATEKAGLALTVQTQTLSQPAYVDRDMWEKIVLNLLSNAFKFTLEGEIAVELSEDAGRARLSVRDTGTGIPANEVPKLFERFHRVEGAKGRSFEGSGIGLALVQELVKLHAGEITVQSEVGRGTTFIVSIPLGSAHLPSEHVDAKHVDPSPARVEPFVEEALRWLPSEAVIDDAAPVTAPGTPAKSRQRVLVADDNADLRDYIGRLLKGRGYKVEAVADGQAALDAIRAARPDILVTDVMMPRLDGFGLLRAIREDETLRDLPVIMLSARAGEEAQVEGLDAGADDYLTKPFSARELLARVETSLAMARLRQEASDALRRANEALERQVGERTRERDRIWELSRDPFLIADMEGRWLSISPAWTELLGWSEAELVGRTSEWMEHPDDRAKTRAEFEHLAAGRITLHFENRFRTKDGSYRWFSWTAVPEGELLYAVARDITLEKAQQAELEATQEALRQSQKLEAMGSLTGGVAHDMNNLLSPIIGGLDLLQRRSVGDERAQRTIAGALQSAERAKTLVQRLLAFARRQPLQLRAVDVGQLVESMAELIGRSAGPQVTVVVDIADDLPPARADAHQVEMAILNLSVNARDAMPHGGRLTIAAAAEEIGPQHRSKLRPGRYVRLAIADTGTGMDEATLARAIEPFFSTKGVGKGTGLGLSMVHGLAAQLGGGLQITSRLRLGTTVELWLPIADAAEADEHKAHGHADAAGRSGMALLVEDEELVRASTADMLSDLGYAVVEAPSAEAALRLLAEGLRPDLLVTDHLMPGMSGTELARELLAKQPGLQVLVVSGYAEVDGVAADLPRLAKPFRRDELTAAISALAEARAT